MNRKTAKQQKAAGGTDLEEDKVVLHQRLDHLVAPGVAVELVRRKLVGALHVDYLQQDASQSALLFLLDAGACHTKSYIKWG